jgi:hypothetical protein
MFPCSEVGMRVFAMLALTLGLAACASVAKNEALTNYRNSRADYRQCTAAPVRAPKECEGLRLIMEADERRYKQLR